MKIKNFIVLILFANCVWSQNSAPPRIIHVFVPLCDNINQGIVPVPALIGNGQDPFNNLYWGAAYGLKNFFDKKSADWTLIKTLKDPKPLVLERLVFKHSITNTYLVADAYDGAYIKQCTIDFLHACSGNYEDAVVLDQEILAVGGKSDLLAYTGHNGLMDFSNHEKFKLDKTTSRDAIILACFSKRYFENYLSLMQVNPLVWSNGLMSPEAYTLKAAIDGWILNESNAQIVDRARKAYHQYQKCGINGATNLLGTGF